MLFFSPISDITKTLSTAYGDILIIGDEQGKEEEEDALSSSSGISSSSFSTGSIYHRDRTERMLDEITEDDENEDAFMRDNDLDEGEESSISCMDNIEEVKRINGRCITTKEVDSGKQLILHLSKTQHQNGADSFNRKQSVRR